MALAQEFDFLIEQYLCDEGVQPCIAIQSNNQLHRICIMQHDFTTARIPWLNITSN